MLEIDGSYGEGGGQILRYALALSAITGRPFRILNIRRGRKKPGLMAQHIASVRAAARITGAVVDGDHYGSNVLVFRPETITAGSYQFDVAEERGSAGAVCLVLQTIVPILLLAEGHSEIRVKGGTHVLFAPIFDYWNLIFAKTLRRIGIEVNGKIIKYGFYPKGGGEVLIRLKGSRPAPVNLLARGRLKAILAVSGVANLNPRIAERQIKPIRDRFTDLDCEIKEVQSVSPGTYIFIKAEYENVLAGFSALGRKGKPAEAVGQECLEQFLQFEESKGAVDPYLADQILLYLLMAEGESSFIPARITNHLKTGIWIINQFVDDAIALKNGLVELSGSI